MIPAHNLRRRIMPNSKEKQVYEREMEQELQTYDKEIEELRRKADKAEAQAKLKFYEQIDALLNKQRDVRKKLQELNRAGEDAWTDLKKGFERARTDLKTAIDRAVSKFKF
jgi:uncharacterized coiled-coil DUF342 family protein